MADTDSAVEIQDEETLDTANVVVSIDDITINGIIWLNPDWSSVNPAEEVTTAEE